MPHQQAQVRRSQALAHKQLFDPVAYHEEVLRQALQQALQLVSAHDAASRGGCARITDSSTRRHRALTAGCDPITGHVLQLSHVPVIGDIAHQLASSTAQVSQVQQATHGRNTTGWDNSGEMRKPMQQYWQECQQDRPPATAIYMVNSPITLHVSDGAHARLFEQLSSFSDDVLHNYPDMYTGASSSSVDVLAGSAGSYTSFHQDGPLRCASLLVVLEGRKLVVMSPNSDEPNPLHKVTATLSALRDPSLQDRVKELRGKVVEVSAVVDARRCPCRHGMILPFSQRPLQVGKGEAVLIPAYWWHAVCNLEASMSINISYCKMDDTAAILTRSRHLFTASNGVLFGDGLLAWARDFTGHLCEALREGGDSDAALFESKISTAHSWRKLLTVKKGLLPMCDKSIKPKAAEELASLAAMVKDAIA